MPVEIIGLHFFADSTETRPVRGVFDREFLEAYAQAHEMAGFDRVLIGQTASWPDSLVTAAYVARCTERLKFMVAHRPGFIAPTMAARMFATLDQLSDGRAGVHIITAASDIETQCDGDFLTKDERYRRAREYVGILRQVWSSREPIDHDGDYYRFRRAFAEVKPVQASIPVFWGGASPLAVQLGAECCDVYAIGVDTLAKTGDLLGRLFAEAATHGRRPSVSMSVRVIVAETEAKAWAKADQVCEAVVAYQARGGVVGRDKGPGDTGTASILATAAEGSRLDERLWTGLAAATQGRTHAMALVGTPAQVAEALMPYYDLGVDRFLLNGFDTMVDVREFARELIPAIHAAVARRDETREPATR